MAIQQSKMTYQNCGTNWNSNGLTFLISNSSGLTSRQRLKRGFLFSLDKKGLEETELTDDSGLWGWGIRDD